MRFRGGTTNLHEYVGNDPLNFIDPTGLAIVINTTPYPVVVSGNVGAGHGEGAHVYGVVPPGGTGGGAGNPVTGYPTRQDAINAYYGAGPVAPPAGPITDVDFYDTTPAIQHAAAVGIHRTARTARSSETTSGPRFDLRIDANGDIYDSSYLLDYPGAYLRALFR